MIKTLELKNFRGIKEGKIELAPMTILIGPNNSGKTAILEALFLTPNPLRETPYSKSVVGLLQAFHQTLEGKGYLFLLRDYISKESIIRYDDNSIFLVKEESTINVLTKNKQIMLGRLNIYDSNIFIHPIHGNLKPEKEILFYSSNLRRPTFRYLRNNWVSIAGSGICRKIAIETSKLIWEEYIDITIEPFTGQLAIYAYLKDGRRIRLGDLGEGVQNYMLIRILCEYIKPGILLWDDVEAHMNPKMLLAIGEWLSKLVEEKTQVVVSTHSLEAVRVIASLVKGTRICLTSLEDGVLKVKHLTLDEIEELRTAGIDVRASAEVLI